MFSGLEKMEKDYEGRRTTCPTLDVLLYSYIQSLLFRAPGYSRTPELYASWVLLRIGLQPL